MFDWHFVRTLGTGLLVSAALLAMVLITGIGALVR